MQTITLRLRLHQPTKAKQAVYRELAVRVTGFANNLVAAGRPKKLTSKTAKPYCPDRIPSAVINQALRDVAAHPKVEKFRVLWPASGFAVIGIERTAVVRFIPGVSTDSSSSLSTRLTSQASKWDW